MLLAYRDGHRAVFLYGFAKSERENITDDELQTLREIGADWLAADAQRIPRLSRRTHCRRCVMTKKTRDTSRLTKALLETADDMRRAGIMTAVAHEKITLRHLGGEPEPGAEPISGEEIRVLRERAHLSQGVFARHLNLTVGYVSQLERGAKQATGSDAGPAECHSPERH